MHRRSSRHRLRIILLRVRFLHVCTHDLPGLHAPPTQLCSAPLLESQPSVTGAHPPIVATSDL